MKFAAICSQNNPSFLRKSSASFWLEYKSKLPTLYDLALKLLVIPASSAYIERFFSVSGVCIDKRRGNMDSEMLCMRSLLKANLNLLSNSI